MPSSDPELGTSVRRCDCAGAIQAGEIAPGAKPPSAAASLHVDGLRSRLGVRATARLVRLLARTDAGARATADASPRTDASGGFSAPREPVREGRLWVWSEHVRPESPGAAEDLARGLRGAGLVPDSVVFLDIESCGLADEPVFLVATATCEGDGLRVEQHLAIDPSCEPELLRRSAVILGGRAAWVSYNGRSFDVPRLRRRARLHGVELPQPPEHRDLLHAVRRRWRDGLPDCRLGTVERRLLGLERPKGDVPGREIPDRYYDFVRTGNRRLIDPVVEHNRRDVLALALLLVKVLDSKT